MSDGSHVRPPRVARLRLVQRGDAASPPRVPLGVAAWSDDAGADGGAIAVALAATSEPLDLAPVVEQVPPAEEQPPGTLVVVLGEASRSGGRLARLFAGKHVSVARALRSSALLARGYVEIGAGVDPSSGADLAWGYTPAVS